MGSVSFLGPTTCLTLSPISLPCSLCCDYTGLCTVLQTHQAQFSLRAFALPVPSGWTALAFDSHTAHSLTSIRVLLYAIYPKRPSLITISKTAPFSTHFALFSFLVLIPTWNDRFMYLCIYVLCMYAFIISFPHTMSPPQGNTVIHLSQYCISSA
jgi:uncharacterized protein YbdZ (MbtH family)